VGGFKESLLMIGLLLVGFIQERLFFSSLLKHIYQVEKKDNHDPGDDHSTPNSRTVKINTSLNDSSHSLKPRSYKHMREQFRDKKDLEKMDHEKLASYYETNTLKQ
jgi:hypothetical protein